MIKEVKTTNFRKHRNLRQIFEPGLNAVRAPNEQGKTTVLEAIMYALFGTKALRTSIDEAVTWGCAPGTLKVEVVVGLGGLEFTFKRGKSGAEVLRDNDVIVTGQTEVSAYAATLLGVDLASAIRLMMSSQNGLRGSLEQGPKATAEMIESLANFDLFERILEAAQEKLTLGPTNNVEAQIERLSASIAEVEAPDYSEIDQGISLQSGAITMTKEKLSAAREELEQATGQLQLAKVARGKYSGLMKAVDTATSEVSVTGSAIVAAEVSAGDLVDPGLIEAAREQITQATDHARRAKAYAVFKSYDFPDENYWDGNEASFETALNNARETLSSAEKLLQATDAAVQLAESQMTVASVCGFCKQDMSQFPEVARRNAELQANANASREAVARLTAVVEDCNWEVKLLLLCAADAVKQRRHFTGYESYIKLGTDSWPAQVMWVGESVDDAAVPDVEALKTELTRLTQRREAALRAEERLHSLRSSLELAKTKLQSAVDALKAEAWPEPPEQLEGEVLEMRSALNTLRDVLAQHESAFNALNIQRARMEQDHKASLAARATAEAEIAAAKQALEDQTFNNALVKKIRGARPIISDKLWNTVLAAVSSMFSKMRGEVSTVAKGKDGFTVNGQSVGSLSGSTLDLLGLAIRVALTKTFLPNCPLLILDEPFAACDEARSNAMLGFIQSSGFQQILLVTHEDASESVADYLITLEAA